MHKGRDWHPIVIAALVTTSLLAGLVAGCSRTETATKTQTATRTQVVTQTSAGPVHTATTTVGAGQTVTMTAPLPVTTTTTTISMPAATVTRTSGPAPTATGAKQTIKLSIGAGHATGSVWVKALDEFYVPETAKRVEARTNYKLEWTRAWGGSVAKLEEVLEAVESGLLDFALIMPASEPTKLPMQAWSYYNPFVSSDPVLIMRAAVKLFERYPELYLYAERNYNQKFVWGLLNTAPYGVISKFPLTKPEDMKGRKIVATGSSPAWFQSVGATPVQGSYVTAHTDLATGVYDGVCGDVTGMWSYKLHEVAPYWTDCGFGAINAGWLAANASSWGKLPKEVQDILMEVGKEHSMVEAQMVVDRIKESEKGLAAGGGQLNVLPYQEQSRWANTLPNIPNNRAKEMDTEGLPGTEVFKAWNQILKDEGFVHPRWWTFD